LPAGASYRNDYINGNSARGARGTHYQVLIVVIEKAFDVSLLNRAADVPNTVRIAVYSFPHRWR